MANNENLIPIPGRLHSVATEGHVSGANEIYDDTQQKDQETINSELVAAVGTGGSVDSKIEAAINVEKTRAEGAESTLTTNLGNEVTRATNAENALDGRVDTLEDAVGTGGSVDSRISDAVATETTRAQAAEADRYTKAETYNKTELNNLITTPNQEYVSVTATDQTTAVTDVLPATGAADTTYRVGNWDGTQYNDSVFSEYAWNGSAYIKLSTKSQIGEVYDISANHADTKYADLTAALNGGANIPQSLQKGGMSVKFVCSSDNKYVQYRLMNNSFSTDLSDWQGVDDKPIYKSENLIKGYGVFSPLATLGVIKDYTLADFIGEENYYYDKNGERSWNGDMNYSIIPYTGIITLGVSTHDAVVNTLKADGTFSRNIGNWVYLQGDYTLNSDEKFLCVSYAKSDSNVSVSLKGEIDNIHEKNTELETKVDIAQNEIVNLNEYVSGITGFFRFVNGKILNPYSGEPEDNVASCVSDFIPVTNGNSHVLEIIASNDGVTRYSGIYNANKEKIDVFYVEDYRKKTYNDNTIAYVRVSFQLGFEASVIIDGVNFSIPKRVTPNNAYEKYKEDLKNVANLCRYNYPPLASTIQKDFAAVLVTDSHGDDVSVKHAYEVAGYPMFDCLIHLGDLQGNNFNNGSKTWFADLVKCSDKPIYIAIGNHDVGNSKDPSVCGSNAQCYEAYIKPIVDKGYLSSGEYTADKCYYYHDFSERRTRLIVLAPFDAPLDMESGSYKTTRGAVVLGQTQAEWLCEKLASTPNGYQVILAMHHPFSSNAEVIESTFSQAEIVGERLNAGTYMDEDVIAMIVNAFVNKTALSVDVSLNGDAAYLNVDGVYYSLSYDFSQRGDAIFAGYIGGHTHVDFVARHRVYTDQYGVYPICSDTQYVGQKEGMDVYADIMTSNYEDDLSYDCLTCVAMDAQNGKIRMMKVGEKHSYIDERVRNYEVLTKSNPI